MSTHNKIFFTLLIASMIGLLAIFPYILTPELLKKVTVPLWLFVSAQLIKNTLILAFCIWIGLLLGKKVGLGTPLLEDFFGHKKLTKSHILSLVKTGIIAGIIAGIAIVIADMFFCTALSSVMKSCSVKPSWWKGLLASFYGGICEEIIMRLFLMTLLVWLFYKIKKSATSVWIAIIVSAVVFGLGHLPATAQLIGLSPLIIVRALVLNGIGGIIFGWLYWKKGLETAMTAHFTCDIILHVVCASSALLNIVVLISIIYGCIKLLRYFTHFIFQYRKGKQDAKVEKNYENFKK